MVKNSVPHTRYAAYGATDIGIIGGGPVGLILAYKAMQAGRSVTLIEKEPMLAPHTALYGEGVALPHHSGDPEWNAVLWNLVKNDLPQIAADLGITLHTGLERGMIELATTQDGVRDLAIQAAYLKDHGIAVDILTSDQLRERAPMLTDAFRASVTGAIQYAEPRLNDTSEFFDALIARLKESPHVQIITGEKMNYVRGYRLSANWDLQGDTMLCPAPKKLIYANGQIPSEMRDQITYLNGIALDAAAHDPVTGQPAPVFEGPSVLYREGDNLLYIVPSGDRTRARLGVTKVSSDFARAVGPATIEEMIPLMDFLGDKITPFTSADITMTALGGPRVCTHDGRPFLHEIWTGSCIVGGVGGDWMLGALALARDALTPNHQ